MRRRDFLRSMAVSPLIARGGVSAGSMLAGMKSAFAANGKTLIVIFQRGGCDGLNTVVPYADDKYYNLRPDIAISAPGSGQDSALDLDGFFGLHPKMSGLYDIFQQGDLAILPTVHYPNANRSHFSSQDYIESGVANQNLSSGWLNRFLSKTASNNHMRGVSFGTLAHSVQGTVPIVTVNSLEGVSDAIVNSQNNALHGVYSQAVSNNDQARFLLHEHGSLALNNLSTIEQLSSTTYVVENGAIYPNTQYGQQLKDVAQLVKAGLGLEIATVSSNGWDHHSDQGGAIGSQANKLADFSSGIAALYKDLGAQYMNDVVILTMSEFGRTAKQNASKGTDHGNASSWFVIGEQVNGGVFGAWPGLGSAQLYQGRYLDHTLNFTDVYAEVLSKHLGETGSLSHELPGSHYQPIGFLT